MEVMEQEKLTRGTKKLIQTAIDEVKPGYENNRYEICAKIAEIVEERYEGFNLDYQLKRMGLETTKSILEKIDMYFYKYVKNS
ncbi:MULTISPECIES: hypothetical protein [Bacillus]|uniref:Uncharacterized protein n=3 Tax=Bacillus cereus group TaxID=86661 RepID=A0A9X6Z582_BACTU|nr:MULTISPECIES: hypothetical protein [Bacillus]AFV22052.1 hypothetical protein BTB_502p07470 [Bacillus thuringiensis Bt407]EEM24931.1 hypothetical protein bthur0002_55730 [Bacillus thuringiensis Bt407]ERI00771.1 hypothetical protein BTCBT_002326 [Bacillus thuringiensis T01-328]MBN6707555.1 hypothetical protein [Bacillus thuringiensis]MDF9599528.1 hypothetical protein [Bacillus cereus]